MSQTRIDGRSPDQLRAMTIALGASPYAEGSVEVSCGNTKLLVAASVEQEVPPWMDKTAGGWITAEYGMLPRATHTRNRREAASGKQSGRTLEIQRLIGRALRAAIDLKQIPGLTIRLDCDVLCADGGTRTAAISGAWVALAQAVAWAKGKGLVAAEVRVRPVGAISVGIVGGRSLLDLCYEEDSKADFDLNVVLDEKRNFIEIQGTAERESVPAERLIELTALATKGIEQVMRIQSSAISQAGLG